METLLLSFNWSNSGVKAPASKTKSRHFGESPAMFPNAQTACQETFLPLVTGNTTVETPDRLTTYRIQGQEMHSITCSRTSSLFELSSCTKMGTAPLSITTFVCSEVPDATFVRAHAASNCTEAKRLSGEYNYELHDKRLKDERALCTCSCGRSPLCRNCTNRGMTPWFITSSMGGLRSAQRKMSADWPLQTQGEGFHPRP